MLCRPRALSILRAINFLPTIVYFPIPVCVSRLLSYVLCLQAVCCADHVHCCPQGHTCDPAESKCEKSEQSSIPGPRQVAWLRKTPARPESSLQRMRNIPTRPESGSQPIDSNLERKTCPGGLVTCRNDETCCRLHTGAYGCCPLPKVSLGLGFWAEAELADSVGTPLPHCTLCQELDTCDTC